MILHHDYDKERQRKEEKPHFLGSPGGLVFMYLITIVISSIVMCWLTGVLGGVWTFFQDPVTKNGLHGLFLGQTNATYGNELDQAASISNLGNFAIAKQFPVIFLVLEITFIVFWSRPILRIHARWRPRQANQYGNDRLTSEPEILRQYPMIADRDLEFPGYGGVPVAHFQPWSIFIKYHPVLFVRDYLKPWLSHTTKFTKGFYAIDQTTVNTLGIGTTRSGKDETEVTPLIDILSRASKKCSMAIFDPKTETLAKTYLNLKKRGYEIAVLNVSDTNYSMSYNPLQAVINYAKDGYYDEAQEAINSIATTIYADPNAKDKFWQESSINLLSSLVLALIDHAERNNRNWKEITMDNVIHMMTELGGKEVLINKEGQIIPGKDDDLPEVDDDKPIAKKPMLVMYFTKLRQLQSSNYSRWRQMALDSFAQSKFSGDETQGNIYSSAIGPIKIYLQTSIGRLTSLNTLDFERLGFPRRLKLVFPKEYRFSTAIIKITDSTGKVIETNNCSVDKLCHLDYAVREKLPENFNIEVSFNFRRNKPVIMNDYITFAGRKVFKRKGLDHNNYVIDEYTKKPVLSRVSLAVNDNQLHGELTKTEFDYSEAPVALFMVTPPNNPSYNQIPAFAVDQLFNALWKMAEKNGRKLVTRTHIVGNEFGNIPTINKMETKISIGLSAGILFDLFVQNLEQFEDHYSKSQADTIKANCANWLYILTNSSKTAQTISTLAGKRTVDVTSNSSKRGDSQSGNVSSSYISQQLLSPTELTNFMGGEMLTLRTTYRQDQKDHSIMAYPIFAHGVTKMPFIHKFLQDEYNDGQTVADIGIKAPHRNLDLDKIRINYDDAYLQLISTDTDDDTETDEESGSFATPEPESKTETGESQENVNANVSDTSFQSSQETTEIDDEPGNKPIFDDFILDNHRFLTDINALIYSYLKDVPPSEVRQEFFNRTYDFWRDPKHNDWEYLRELFAGNSELYNSLRETIKQKINNLMKG